MKKDNFDIYQPIFQPIFTEDMFNKFYLLNWCRPSNVHFKLLSDKKVSRRLGF